ncbi:hypothetical protein F4604DRAFT_1919596 [Suillus subluteus]|nr:hypothetical protein F4604DRAFT_1919596 [Suillus subluteus]
MQPHASAAQKGNKGPIYDLGWRPTAPKVQANVSSSGPDDALGDQGPVYDLGWGPTSPKIHADGASSGLEDDEPAYDLGWGGFSCDEQPMDEHSVKSEERPWLGHWSHRVISHIPDLCLMMFPCLPDAHLDLHTLTPDSIPLFMPSVLQSTIGSDPCTFAHPYIYTSGPPQLSLLHPPLVQSDPSSFHLGLYLPLTPDFSYLCFHLAY